MIKKVIVLNQIGALMKVPRTKEQKIEEFKMTVLAASMLFILAISLEKLNLL